MWPSIAPALSLTVSNIPTDGRTVYVSLYSMAGGNFTLQDTATYTAANITNAVITTPTKGATLGSSTATFGWSPQTGATSYRLYVGSTPGAYDIAALLTPNLSLAVGSIPTDGRTLYVTLFGNSGGPYVLQDTATYTAAKITKAIITGPSKGSTLTGATVTFNWTAETGGIPAASSYRLYVGSTPGAYDLGALQVSGLSVIAGNLPKDGRQIYVTLYGNAGGSFVVQDTATYTAFH